MRNKIYTMITMIIVLIIIIFLHELGHIIGFLLYDVPILGIRFHAEKLTNASILTGLVAVATVPVDLSLIPSLLVLLIIPLFLEYTFLYLTKQSKWFYLLALCIHRYDLLQMLSIVI